jgi:hypothetical protein
MKEKERRRVRSVEGMKEMEKESGKEGMETTTRKNDKKRKPDK